MVGGHDDVDPEFVDAFRSLLPQARRLAHRVLGDTWAAEDVAAEALARTYARWDRVRTLPWRDAWVLRVATNLAIDATRRRRMLVDAPTPAPDGGDEAVLRVALVAALRALPRRQREAVALRYLAGLDEGDVARALGVAPGTVKSHLHRGIAALRRRLGPGFDEEDPLAFQA